MAFPLYYFLFPYLVFLLAWSVMSAVALYHMLKFGVKNKLTVTAVAAYLVVAAGLLMASLIFIIDIDWQYMAGTFTSGDLYKLPDY